MYTRNLRSFTSRLNMYNIYYTGFKKTIEFGIMSGIFFEIHDTICEKEKQKFGHGTIIVFPCASVLAGVVWPIWSSICLIKVGKNMYRFLTDKFFDIMEQI